MNRYYVTSNIGLVACNFQGVAQITKPIQASEI